MKSTRPSIQLNAPFGPVLLRGHEGPACQVDPGPSPLVAPANPIKRCTPHGLFALQALRTRARLEQDTLMEVDGKPRTLPFDHTMDFRANSENLVRDHWVRLGVWQKEWGRAWPKRSKPALNRNWLPGPKFTGGPSIPADAKWPHEMEPVSVWKGVPSLIQRLASLKRPFKPEPVADFAPEPGREPETDQESDNESDQGADDETDDETEIAESGAIFGRMLKRFTQRWTASQGEAENKDAEKKIDIEERKRIAREDITIARSRVHPERSRPLYQFYALIPREVAWIKDGWKYYWPDYEPSASDLWNAALDNVKAAWVQDGI
jgi:hypothetical protein